MGLEYDMAALMMTMGGLGGVAAIGGTVMSAAGAISEGKSQQRASNFQAAQLDQQANMERASAVKSAQESRRQSEIAMSRARAVGAASGGGIDVPLMGQIEEDAELRAGVAMWEGEEAAKGRKMQASAARYDGNQYARAGAMRAGATLLSGGSSFLEMYG